MAQKDYNPLKDTVYMSPQMKEFFKDKLHEELEKLDEEISSAMSANAEDRQSHPDFLDQALGERTCKIGHRIITLGIFLLLFHNYLVHLLSIILSKSLVIDDFHALNMAELKHLRYPAS
jgi:hypothetical protein